MDVTMPQLGETVTEGTITRWFKQVGERVEVDEPLFEVSTDKVDSEVPSPIAGLVSEILVPEGETVAVGVRLAVVSSEGDAPPTPEPPPMPEPPPAPEPPPTPEPTPAAAQPAALLTSPIVRRLLAEHGLDPRSISGTGAGGRVTRRDVEAAVQGARAVAPPPAAPAVVRGTGDVTVPFDEARTRAAEAAVRSVATSPHVYTSVEVDFEHVERSRSVHAAEWLDVEGFDLDYLPFVVRAFSDVARDYPHVNASVATESLVVHRELNLGVTVDLDDGGMAVPVVRNVDGKRLRLIAAEVHDLAKRARGSELQPAEVEGATFTITDVSSFGAELALPVINQPQVAMLAVGAVGKAPVVVEGPDGEDAIAVHHVGHLALTWDHRAFDGAYAAAFLAGLRDVLETRDWESEIA